MNIGTEKEMKDGTMAYLSNSKRYFVRKMPNLKRWTRIEYYTKDGEKIELAKARCGECKKLMKSKMCGHYVGCKCGKSFIDTDRWFPERHRYGGEARPINK